MFLLKPPLVFQLHGDNQNILKVDCQQPPHAKHVTSGVGTVATISGSAVTKVVVVTDTPSGSTTVTTDTPIVVDAASTLSGVSTSDSVGIVTTTGDS